MTLKKPAELFKEENKRLVVREEYSHDEDPLSSSSGVAEIFDRFKSNLNIINSLSESETFNQIKDNVQKIDILTEKVDLLSEQIEGKLTKNDLENAMLSHLLIIDENFQLIDDKVKSLNKEDLKVFKEDVKNLNDLVSGLIENEIPKYKKSITGIEFNFKNKIEQYKEYVNDQLNACKYSILEFKNILENDDNNIDSYKEDVEKLHDFVLNLVENEIPKYKKSINTVEISFRNKVDEYKLHVEEKVNSYNDSIVEFKNLLDDINSKVIDNGNNIVEYKTQTTKLIEDNLVEINNVSSKLTNSVQFYREELREEFNNLIGDFNIKFEQLENKSEEKYNTLIDYKEEVSKLVEEKLKENEDISKQIEKRYYIHKDEITEEVKTLSDDVKNLQTEVLGNVEKSLTHIQEEVKSLTGNVEDLQLKVLDDVEKSLAHIQEDFDEKKIDLFELEDRISDSFNKSKSHIDELSETLETSIRKIEGNFSELKGDITQSKKEIETFTEELGETVDEVKNDISLYESRVIKVENFILKNHSHIVKLRREVFDEIEKLSLDDLTENIGRIETKIDKVQKAYEDLQSQNLLNESLLQEALSLKTESNPGNFTEPADVKNSDPLTPLNQNFVTKNDLEQHYKLFLNRIQQQLSTLGGGGETQLKYLDDIVGIATNASFYDGKFLKYDHSLRRFVFETVTQGGGGGNAAITISDTFPVDPEPGNLWYDSSIGRTFIYYVDGDSAQWVDASPSGSYNTSSGAGESYWASTSVGIHTLSNVGVGTTNPTARVTIAEPIVDTSSWALRYGDLGIGQTTQSFSSVSFDSLGNIYASGSDYDNGLPYIVKFDTDGTILWQKFFEHSDPNRAYKICESVVVDRSTDNVYVAVNSDDVVGSAIIVKLDSSGTILWQNEINGSGYDYSTDLDVSSGGDVYIVGGTYSQGSGSDDAIIVKFNSSGVQQWQKVIGDQYSNTGYNVSVDSSDNVYVTGVVNTAVITNKNAFVVKFNSSGTVQWQKTIEGTFAESGFGVSFDSSNNVYIVGDTNTQGSGDYDATLIKLNPSGVLQWQRVIGKSGYDSGTSVVVGSDNKIYITGQLSTNKLFIVGFDTLGNQLFKKEIKSYDPKEGIYQAYYWGRNVIDSIDSTLVIGGYVYDTADDKNALLIKIPASSISKKSGSYGDSFSIKESDLVVGISTLTVNSSSLTISNSTLTVSTAGLTTSLTPPSYTSSIDYFTATSLIVGGEAHIDILETRDFYINDLPFGMSSGDINNFIVGIGAGVHNTTGHDNIFLGYNTGSNNQTGSYNIAIGSNLELPVENGSEQLIIGRGAFSWIVGNKDYNVGIGLTNPTSKLTVNGDIRAGVDNSHGIILTSPSGLKYRLTVDDSGNLSTVLVP